MVKKVASICLCMITFLGLSLNSVAAEEKNSISVVRADDSNISFVFSEKESLFNRDSFSQFFVKDTNAGLEVDLQLLSNMASKEYQMTFDIPEGSSLTLPEGDQADGSILIKNDAGELIGTVDPLSVHDAYGTEVPTSVRIQENVAIYTIDDFDKSVTYPLNGEITLYADANSFSTWFQYGKWELRNGYKTLSLMPTSDWHSLDVTTAQLSWSWGTVKAKFSGHEYWFNETGLYDQYYCHVLGSFVSPDEEWNLEPERPAVGTIETIKAKCNP